MNHRSDDTARLRTGHASTYRHGAFMDTVRARARPALWVRNKQPHALPPGDRPSSRPFAIVHEPQAFKAGSLMLR